jgi:pimeloyl-ACP methyl ester carboxylesterase
MVSPLVQYRLLTWLPGKLTKTALKMQITNKHQLPRYEVGAVILHSPLMSGMRVAFPKTQRTWCFDAFPSIDKVSKVTSPVLVIHGTEDEVIDFSHGIAIHDKCPKAVEPLWVEVNKQTIKSTAF